MRYKTDLHCHTSEKSACARESAPDTVEHYIASGYTSVVITNHFSCENIDAPENYRMRYSSYADMVDATYDAIDLARSYAGDRLNVLDGIELTYPHAHAEFLILGADRALMHSFPEIFSLDAKEIRKFFNDHSCVFVQAHPTRIGMTLFGPESVDGYEVYNASPEEIYLNPAAEMWAKVNGGDALINTAGTDHHLAEEVLTAGILTDEPIKTNTQLVNILKNKQYTIFHD